MSRACSLAEAHSSTNHTDISQVSRDKEHLEAIMKVMLFSLIFAVSANLSAQEVPTFSTKVNVVSLLATVQDRDGRVVKNLTSDDFALMEDGVPQKIRYFSQETNLPLTIGLLVDTSRSQSRVLQQERRASYRFLDQVLRANQD